MRLILVPLIGYESVVPRQGQGFGLLGATVMRDPLCYLVNLSSHLVE